MKKSLLKHMKLFSISTVAAVIFLVGADALCQEVKNAGIQPPPVKREILKDAGNKIIPPVETMGSYWDQTLKKLEGNFNFGKLTAKDIFFFTIGLMLTLVVARFSRWFLENYAVKLASHTETEVDDLVFSALGRPLSLLVVAIGIYGSSSLVFPLMSEKVIAVAGKLCTAISAVAIAWAMYRLVSVVDYLVGRFAKRSDNDLDDLVVPAISRTLKAVVVIFSVLLIGQNIFNINITTLLAGAGVAGLAVAFAAQDTIANVFGSIMVILDQPFKAGEVIKVGDVTGQVEQIGFRSTKIRTLNGHLVTIPNKNMANATIENISKRASIKHEMNLTLVYDTSPEKMEKAVKILHEIFDNHENMRPEFPPRIFFNSFKDWSLNIYMVVWFSSGDYFSFLDWLHRKNLEILKRFNDEGIDFAFPSNTTYLAGDPKRKPEFLVKR
ncbi:MAG: mechanosensitive ion channel family protein [Victivallales bacterium]